MILAGRSLLPQEATLGVGNMQVDPNEHKILEIQTKSGYRINIYNNAILDAEKIKIQKSDEDILTIIESGMTRQFTDVSTKMNLSIKADNIEIEAKESMNLKSGSILTINGSLVKIN